MPLRVLIAPDKFKGALRASEVAAALRDGLLATHSSLTCVCRPVADGGEGTAEALCQALGGDWVETSASDPLGRPIRAHYAWLPGERAALDMSEASGLWRLGEYERDPLRASTRGTGELLRQILDRRPREVLIGLGGSATNDAGMGLAEALGYQFLNAAEQPVPALPAHLDTITSLRAPAASLALPSGLPLTGLCDVRNPLLGPRGASRVFGPQKGATPAQVEELDRLLGHLAGLVQRDLGHAFSDTPGAGAAGGLGFGLLSFCGARLRPGFTTLADWLKLEEEIARSDLVITGEGRLDRQTLEGKAPAGVAALARRHGKAVVAFAGSIEDCPELRAAFDQLIPITPPGMPLAQALACTRQQLALSAPKALSL